MSSSASQVKSKLQNRLQELIAEQERIEQCRDRSHKFQEHLHSHEREYRASVEVETKLQKAQQDFKESILKDRFKRDLESRVICKDPPRIDREEQQEIMKNLPGTIIARDLFGPLSAAAAGGSGGDYYMEQKKRTLEIEQQQQQRQEGVSSGALHRTSSGHNSSMAKKSALKQHGSSSSHQAVGGSGHARPHTAGPSSVGEKLGGGAGPPPLPLHHKHPSSGAPLSSLSAARNSRRGSSGNSLAAFNTPQQHPAPAPGAAAIHSSHIGGGGGGGGGGTAHSSRRVSLASEHGSAFDGHGPGGAFLSHSAGRRPSSAATPQLYGDGDPHGLFGTGSPPTVGTAHPHNQQYNAGNAKKKASLVAAAAAAHPHLQFRAHRPASAGPGSLPPSMLVDCGDKFKSHIIEGNTKKMKQQWSNKNHTGTRENAPNNNSNPVATTTTTSSSSNLLQEQSALSVQYQQQLFGGEVEHDRRKPIDVDALLEEQHRQLEREAAEEEARRMKRPSVVSRQISAATAAEKARQKLHRLESGDDLGTREANEAARIRRIMSASAHRRASAANSLVGGLGGLGSGRGGSYYNALVRPSSAATSKTNSPGASPLDHNDTDTGVRPIGNINTLVTTPPAAALETHRTTVVSLI